MKYFSYLSCIAILLTAQTLSAESMSGGGYTLTGSVDVITDQGIGGGYTLNPQGDPIAGQNSMGGGYIMQPTPYMNPQSASQGEVMSAAVTSSGQTYGTEAVSTSSASNSVDNVHIQGINSPANPTSENENENKIKQSNRQIYEDYIYPAVRFGHGIQTVEDFAQTPKGKSLGWIIILALIIILIRSWINYKNPSKKA